MSKIEKSGTTYKCFKCNHIWDYNDDACPNCGGDFEDIHHNHDLTIPIKSIEEKNKRKTFFGSLEPLLIRNKKVISELAYFHSNGKSHTHNQWEICYVLKGRGRIIYQWQSQRPEITKVEMNSIVKIPPYCAHWMEVDEGKTMEILLVYSNNS